MQGPLLFPGMYVRGSGGSPGLQVDPFCSCVGPNALFFISCSQREEDKAPKEEGAGRSQGTY
jgi:hypothetical protein